MKEGQLLGFCLWRQHLFKSNEWKKRRSEEEKRTEKQRPLSQMSFKDLPYYNIAQQLTLDITFFILFQQRGNYIYAHHHHFLFGYPWTDFTSLLCFLP